MKGKKEFYSKEELEVNKKKSSSNKGKLMRTIVGKELVNQLKSGEKINPSQAMRYAGYSENYLNTHGKKKVMESNEVQNELSKFQSDISEIKQLSIENAKNKALSASFRDSINAISTLQDVEIKERMQSGAAPEQYFKGEHADIILERIQRVKISGNTPSKVEQQDTIIVDEQ